jgi:hypothetical protein
VKFPIPTQLALEISCAAQRVNGNYVKETIQVYDDQGNLSSKYSNKTYIKNTALGSTPDLPEWVMVTVLDEDKILAENIQKYFRRLIFTAVTGEDGFMTDLYNILNKAKIDIKELGFIACLPSVYERELAKSQMIKLVKTLDDVAIGSPGSSLHNLDCEIVGCKKSKNFDAYNVEAIIHNKLVTWFQKNDVKTGPTLLVKGRVKEVRSSYYWNITETRLNYVKLV